MLNEIITFFSVSIIAFIIMVNPAFAVFIQQSASNLKRLFKYFIYETKINLFETSDFCLYSSTLLLSHCANKESVSKSANALKLFFFIEV